MEFAGLLDQFLHDEKVSNAGDYHELDLTGFLDFRVFAMGPPRPEPTSKAHNINNISMLSRLLNKKYPCHYLLWDLLADSNSPSDLHGQVCHFKWQALSKASIPSLDLVLKICYSIKAWLDMDRENKAFLYCTNGKTRSGVVMACLLRLYGEAPTAMEGFFTFCNGRCHGPMDDIQHKIPPSLQGFFAHFDMLMELGHYLNPTPMALHRIRIKGLPVDDMPCVEVYDHHHKIYTSTKPESCQGAPSWQDDGGEYPLMEGVKVLGDFVVVCRFGGQMSGSEHDPAKTLFRYVGHTGFLDGQPLILHKPQVDMMKRYADLIDDQAFVLELDFQPDTKTTKDEQLLASPCMSQEGLVEISQHHHVIPNAELVKALASLGYPEEACGLALQLGNNDLNTTLHMMDKVKHALGIPPSTNNSPQASLSEMRARISQCLSTRQEVTSAVTQEDKEGGRRISLETRAAEAPPKARARRRSSFETHEVCGVCHVNDPLPDRRKNLVVCSKCHGAYHTYCLKPCVKEVPFRVGTPYYEAYMRKNFSTWCCPTCMAQMESPNAGDNNKSSPIDPTIIASTNSTAPPTPGFPTSGDRSIPLSPPPHCPPLGVVNEPLLTTSSTPPPPCPPEPPPPPPPPPPSQCSQEGTQGNSSSSSNSGREKDQQMNREQNDDDDRLMMTMLHSAGIKPQRLEAILRREGERSSGGEPGEEERKGWL